MAYLTQYDVDREQADRVRSNLSKIGDAVSDGMKWYEENRRRAIDEKRKATQDEIAVKRQAKQDEIDAENRQREQEKAERERAKAEYEAKQRILPYDQRDDFKKDMAVARARDEYMANRLGNQEQMRIEAEQRKMINDQKVKDAEGQRPLPNFEVAPGNRLEDKDREVLKAQDTAVRNIDMIGNRLKDNIKKFGITSGTGVTAGDRAVASDLTDLQLQMKELFNLGVLNGPDLELLNKNLGSLQGPMDMLNPFNTRDNAISQVQNVIDSAVGKLKNTAAARGAVYTGDKNKPQVAIPIQQQPADVQAAKAQRLNELRAKKALLSGGQ